MGILAQGKKTTTTYLKRRNLYTQKMPETVANNVSAQAEVAPVDVTAPSKSDEVEDDATAGNMNVVAGPTQDGLTWSEKKAKAVLKEGGKRGVEIEGAADMGGLQFFCTMMTDVTEGKVEYLVESMKAMNAISDPTEEERKGGAGKLGKMIFSFTEDCLACVAYVPKDKAEECPAKEWLQDTVSNIASLAVAEQVVTYEDQGISSKNWASIAIKVDGEKGLYPIKMRDPAITVALTYLRKKGLFPTDDDEDDDDYVFGDEDFPS